MDAAKSQGLHSSARAPLILSGVEGPSGSWLGHGALWASVLEDGIGLTDLSLTVPAGAWEAELLGSMGLGTPLG